MKITKVEAYSLTLPIREEHIPFLNYGRREKLYTLIVKVFTDDGIVGLGEGVCNPFGARFLPTQGMALELIRSRLGPALIGEDPFKIRCIHAKMKEAIAGNLSIKGAFDMAMYDIMGKKLGVPVYDLIGGNSYGKTEFHYDVDLPIRPGFVNTPEAMAQKAEECVKKLGYKRWGIKLGLPGEPIEREIQRIRMVCEAIGPDIPLHMDPNTGWGLEKTIKILSAVRGCNISDVHQPVPSWDVEGLALLTQMFPEVPIIADESAFEGYFTEIIRRRAVNAIALKPFHAGGYYPTLQMIGACEQVGIRVYMNGLITTNVQDTATAYLALMLGPGNLSSPSTTILAGYETTTLQIKPPNLVKKGGIQVVGKRMVKISSDPGLGIIELNEDILKPELGVTVV